MNKKVTVGLIVGLLIGGTTGWFGNRYYNNHLLKEDFPKCQETSRWNEDTEAHYFMAFVDAIVAAKPQDFGNLETQNVEKGTTANRAISLTRLTNSLHGLSCAIEFIRPYIDSNNTDIMAHALQTSLTLENLRHKKIKFIQAIKEMIEKDGSAGVEQITAISEAISGEQKYWVGLASSAASITTLVYDYKKQEYYITMEGARTAHRAILDAWKESELKFDDKLQYSNAPAAGLSSFLKSNFVGFK